MSNIQTYKVWLTLYDNKEHTSYSSNNTIDTYIQAQNYQQVVKMVEAQYNGCAKLNSASVVS